MTARRIPDKAPATVDRSAVAPVSPWPALSVVIPTHNRHELMAAAVRSVLAQDYPGPIECIVVFDREEPFQPPVVVPEGRTVRIMTNARTPGPAGARNAGVIAATGELVAFLDDDDEWLPAKLRLQVRALQAHPDSAVAVTGIFLGTGLLAAAYPAQELLTLEHLLRGRRIEVHSSSVMVKRSSYLDEIGLLDEAIPGSYGEDYDWHLRSARLAPLVAVRQPLVRVRWQYSYFVDRWHTIIKGLQYQLDHRTGDQPAPAEPGPHLRADRVRLRGRRRPSGGPALGETVPPGRLASAARLSGLSGLLPNPPGPARGAPRPRDGAGGLAMLGVRPARPAPAPRAPSLREGTPHLRPAWLVNLMFLGLFVWWGLGVSGFIQVVLAVPIVVALFVRGKLRVPRSYLLWVCFLAWMLVTYVQVKGISHTISFGGGVPSTSPPGCSSSTSSTCRATAFRPVRSSRRLPRSGSYRGGRRHRHGAPEDQLHDAVREASAGERRGR